MRNVRISGISRTAFGKFPSENSLSLQREVSIGALADAGVRPADLDAVITGYSTVSPHLMPANVLSEALGARPRICFGMSLGGATGIGMMIQACQLVESGTAEHVLVVAGENRATGQTRKDSTSTLAQVAHPRYELPIGVTVPALYALLASEYYHRYGLSDEALASIAVQMRANAVGTEGAQYRTPLTTDDVISSPPVASPLRLFECSPVSDGAVALLVSHVNSLNTPGSVQVAGVGSANRAQHISSLDFTKTGARESATSAFSMANVALTDVNILGVYDSFTVTLAMLLEEIGFSIPGETGYMAAAGEFSTNGTLPLNLHGGLLSYGHSGVAGGLAHVVEVAMRLRSGAALGNGAVPEIGYVHGDGGVMSAHASMILRKDR